MEKQNQEKRLVNQNTKLATLSKEKLLKVYNPKICLLHAGKLRSVEDAMNAKAPTISGIRREHEKKFIESLILAWLVYLNITLNLKKSMHDEQMMLCSTMIVDEFSMLNFADLTLLFRRIISGECGKFYESLSIADVLTFFREYLEERFDLAAQESIRKHQDIQGDQTFNISKNTRRQWQNGAKTN